MEKKGYVWIGIGAVIGAAIGFWAVSSYNLELVTKDNIAGWFIALFLIQFVLLYGATSKNEDPTYNENPGCTSSGLAFVGTVFVLVIINYAVGVLIGALIGAVISAIIYYVFKATQDS